MKHVFKPGDRIRGGCDVCRALVHATYDYGQLELDDGTVVENVMRATCDTCQSIVAVAHQSAPAIKSARVQRDDKKRRTTVRLSRPLYDFAASQLLDRGGSPDRFDLIIKAFADMAMASEPRHSHLVEALRNASDPVLLMGHDVTVHLDMSEGLWRYLEEMRLEAGITNGSDFVRRMLVVMDNDKKTVESVRKVVLLR